MRISGMKSLLIWPVLVVFSFIGSSLFAIFGALLLTGLRREPDLLLLAVGLLGPGVFTLLAILCTKLPRLRVGFVATALLTNALLIVGIIATFEFILSHRVTPIFLIIAATAIINIFVLTQLISIQRSPSECLNCGYDLRASDSSRCSECGHSR